MQRIAKVVQQHWRAAAGVAVAVIEEDTHSVYLEMSRLLTREREYIMPAG